MCALVTLKAQLLPVWWPQTLVFIDGAAFFSKETFHIRCHWFQSWGVLDSCKMAIYSITISAHYELLIQYFVSFWHMSTCMVLSNAIKNRIFWSNLRWNTVRFYLLLSFVKIEQECLALFVSVKRHNNPGWTFHLLQKGWRLKGQKARGKRRTLSSKVGSKVKFGERDSLKPDEVAAHKDCKGRFLDTRTEEFSASSKVPF